MAVNQTPRTIFTEILKKNHPDAIAWVEGNELATQLNGSVKFYRTPYGGVLVEAEIFGLPNINIQNSSDFYAMHIHEYGDCSEGFAHVGGHYNPSQVIHPNHAGDLPPLMANQGYAWTSFYDKRFGITEIIGRSVIIHSFADDFTTQPVGNAGGKIGCGTIRLIGPKQPDSPQ